MLKILQNKSSPLQKVDRNGFIKRDFAAEKQLTNQIKSRAVINFDLDEILSDDEQDKNNQSNQSDNASNSSKLLQIKNFVIRNPYLKEIVKEAKHFISRKSASLKEYFNFAAMNPFDNNTNEQQQNNNVEQQSNNQKVQNQQQNGSQVQNKDIQSISSILEDIQGNQDRSESSIGSNAHKFSQNDSLSISSRVQQFIQEQKNHQREQEERRINSLNLSFRSAQNYQFRQSITSAQSETVQNKRQNKLMESIMQQNSKKLKTSQEETNKLVLNKKNSIRFIDINKAFENEDLEQTNYDHKISKQKSILAQSEIMRKRNDSQAKGSQIQGSQQNLTEEEIEDQKRKDLKIEMEARKFVMNKLPQTAKIRVQLKTILEMKQQARKLNINYSQYAEELHQQQQISQNSYKQSQPKDKDLKEQKEKKHKVVLNAQQLKDLNRLSNSHYSQFLQDPDVVLSRESSYIAYKSQVQQGETSKLSHLSKQQSSQQKNYISDHESTLLVDQNKIKSKKDKQANKEIKSANNNNYSDSQSNFEESCSSPVSSSNSITSNKKPKLSQQPFDDEFSMSSIQRHTDDEDSAIIMNIFPNNSSAPNNNNTLNSNTQSQNNQSTQQSQLFKKPQEKKVTEEPSSTIFNTKVSTPQSQAKENQDNKEQNNLFGSTVENNQNSAVSNLFSNIKPQNQEQSKQDVVKDSAKKVETNEKESTVAPKPTGGLFSNLGASEQPKSLLTAAKPQSTGLFTETKPTSASASLFTTEVKPASTQLFSGQAENKTTETKPAQGSLFSNLATPAAANTTTTSASTSTENKPVSLFGNLIQKPNQDTDKIVHKTETKEENTNKTNQNSDANKSTGLFSNLNGTSTENSTQKQGGLFANVNGSQPENQKQGGLFSNLNASQPENQKQEGGLLFNQNGASTESNAQKSGGLFSNLNGSSSENNTSKQGGLFSNIQSNSSENSSSKTPEKKAEAPSLFAPLQTNNKKEGQNTQKDNEVEMASENTHQDISSLNNTSKTSQILSTPQPTQNSQSLSNPINPFGNAPASPFSQNNPFSNSSQQNKASNLQDLVSSKIKNDFSQSLPQVQNSNMNNNLQGSLFQASNNSLFNSFQQPSNLMFQPNQAAAPLVPQMNTQMTSTIGSFQGSIPNQAMGMNTPFSGMSQQYNNSNMYNGTNMNLSANNNNNSNNIFNQNNNMNVSNPMTQLNFQQFNALPQTNYFGVNNSTIPANSQLFQSTPQNTNSFMNQTSTLSSNQSASLFGGAQPQTSLFSSVAGQQNSSNNFGKKKATNNRQRI